MRVFLGNPPWREGRWRGVRAGSRWPHLEPPGSPYLPFPFFLAYASATLRREGHQVTLVDGIAAELSPVAFVARARGARPDLVVLETSLPSRAVDAAIVAAMRDALPQARLAVAGAADWAAGDDPLAALPAADLFLIGEYETTLVDLCARLEAGRDPAGPGLLVRGAAAGVPLARPPAVDVAALPWPDRASLPMHRYADAVGYLPQPLLQVWASRGCPFGCDFCLWPQAVYGARRYRPRPPEDVVAEIADAVARYRLRAVYFDDDTFNIGDERLLTLADLLARTTACLPFGVMARADTCSREAWRALARAGLRYVKLGVESGDQGLLDAMGKQLRLQQVRETVGWLRELGVLVHLTFTLGHPDETAATARRTIDFALELDPDSLQLALLMPFPGTALHTRAVAEGLLTPAAASATGYARAAAGSRTLDPVTLENLLRDGRHRWYAHLARRVITNPRRDLGRAARYVVANPRHALGLLRAALTG